jgi:hypothetical protein
MALVDVKIGQLVYIIENYEIYEANITRFINQKEVIVTIKDYSYSPKKTYGVDFFFTREKADKVLSIQLEKFMKKQLNQRQKRDEEMIRFERERNRVDEGSVKSICNSCGLPIGKFGHCGCSY